MKILNLFGPLHIYDGRLDFFLKKTIFLRKKNKCNLVTLKEISTLHTPTGLVY